MAPLSVAMLQRCRPLYGEQSGDKKVSTVTDVEVVTKETINVYQDHRGKYNDKESTRTS